MGSGMISGARARTAASSTSDRTLKHKLARARRLISRNVRLIEGWPLPLTQVFKDDPGRDEEQEGEQSGRRLRDHSLASSAGGSAAATAS